jgi:site-specific DNA-cytosine methylase
MKVVSLFSGIEGFGLALERCGMKIIYQVEQEPFCLAVLKDPLAGCAEAVRGTTELSEGVDDSEFPLLPKGQDSARYRALGNAVTVSVVHWIGKRIVAYESE